jgi:hypothetical protein
VPDGIALLNAITVSALAMAKSGRVLKALAFLYFPFHGIRRDEMFEHFGHLAFLSAAMYQADERNEQGRESRSTARLTFVQSYLAAHGMLDERTKRYVSDGEAYLRFERRLRNGDMVSLDEVRRVMECRSWDFRILHCVIHHLKGIPYRPDVFSAFSALELLMEIEDDNGSYEEDLRKGSFNFVSAIESVVGRGASDVVETIRNDAILDLRAHVQRLPPPSGTRLARTMRAYRTLVPKRPIHRRLDRHRS